MRRFPLQSIGEFQNAIFTKEDIFEVIKSHPGITCRNILRELGLGMHNHHDRQIVNLFLNQISLKARKLKEEGKIRILERTDRFEYFPISRKGVEEQEDE